MTTEDTSKPEALSTDQAGELCLRVRQSIAQAVVGQRTVIDQILVAMLAAGHVLVEGVPGLGKTLLARALARTFEGEFARIQFTPDLMPTDITGHVLYDMKNEQFSVRKGRYLHISYWLMRSTEHRPSRKRPFSKSCKNSRSASKGRP